ncbi:hypothetical protein [Herbiconiux ginsengi]|uniref:hypothetical protein n=1 Tax=Herbiconiux ginsengi TaxID=381665 RepID=UPI0011148A95|nr:hypothetical protein [Herbiconiux ginsengi]
MTNLDMLEHPEELYKGAPDPIRRQLLDAFFNPVHLAANVAISAIGESWRAVRELEAAAEAHRESRADKNSRSPGLSAGNPAVYASVGSLADFLGP